MLDKELMQWWAELSDSRHHLQQDRLTLPLHVLIGQLRGWRFMIG